MRAKETERPVSDGRSRPNKFIPSPHRIDELRQPVTLQRMGMSWALQKKARVTGGRPVQAISDNGERTVAGQTSFECYKVKHHNNRLSLSMASHCWPFHSRCNSMVDNASPASFQTNATQGLCDVIITSRGFFSANFHCWLWINALLIDFAI